MPCNITAQGCHIQQRGAKYSTGIPNTAQGCRIQCMCGMRSTGEQYTAQGRLYSKGVPCTVQVSSEVSAQRGHIPNRGAGNSTGVLYTAQGCPIRNSGAAYTTGAAQGCPIQHRGCTWVSQTGTIFFGENNIFFRTPAAEG